MLNQEKMFHSPQTGSAYLKVTLGYADSFVAARRIGKNEVGNDVFRISIRVNDLDTLMGIYENLSDVWSSIKDDDHVSVVTDHQGLLKLVQEAINVVEDTEINPTWYEELTGTGTDTDGVAYIVDTVTQVCPYCEMSFKV